MLARALAGAADAADALGRAAVVVCAPDDVVTDPALGACRFARVVIDLTDGADPALAAVAAARSRRTVTVLSPGRPLLGTTGMHDPGRSRQDGPWPP